ncbi:blue copper protein-like [Durio zibethinus]|uniref:Blue copper protein-like n=1 Tax=Durio zibethinus TaxID=66656 RepID=A0A6P5YFB2_DURZI|nr:blue copper protein-like [Durio zibethinus]
MPNFIISKASVNLSFMAKLILLCFLAVFCFALTSDATTYVVGDTSGWDISTDIDSWVSDKGFSVGDVLLFQYSSYHSVSEVTKKSFKTCNTTDTLRTFSNGNTTVTLSNAGAAYFVCGNKLHCLGGMRLQVNVEGDQTSSTVGAPEAQPGTTLQQPASKTNNPTTVIPTSSGYIIGGIQSLIIAFLCLTATMLLLFQT